MNATDWQACYVNVSNELLWLAKGKLHNPDENVSEREGALLEELDELELTAAAMLRAGKTG